MDAIIRDPNTGDGVKVNEEGMAKACCVYQSQAQHTNVTHEEMFTMLIDETPAAIDDCIAYIQNGKDVDMIIDSIDIPDVGADMMLYIQLGDSGSRNAAGNVIPVNLNSGSGITANGNSIFETGVDLDGGAATLAGGAESHRIKALAAGEHVHYDFPGKIILQKNQTLTLWGDVSNTVLAFISFHYHD